VNGSAPLAPPESKNGPKASSYIFFFKKLVG
jgi:hypothetical protein